MARKIKFKRVPKIKIKRVPKPVTDKRLLVGVYGWDLQPCGTYAASRRHRRNGEPMCKPCHEAEIEYGRERYAAKKRRQNA